MAARKKAKSKTQRKKTPARKPAARKKTAQVRKKAAIRKAPARRAAPKKKPAARRVAPKKRVVSRAVPVTKPAPAQPAAPPRRAKPAPARRAAPPHPAAPAVPAASAPAPLANEERIGSVTHYYSHLSVAVVRLESGTLRVGDTIHITGHTTDFRQPVESLQIEHQPVSEVSGGQEFGLGVIDHAREHDAVYKVKAY